MQRPVRESIRWEGYDYRLPGWYFVTICTVDREPLFGQILDGVMQLSSLGEIVEEEWLRSLTLRRELDFDTYIVMPNHFHGIVVLTDPSDEGGRTANRCTGNSGRIAQRATGAPMGDRRFLRPARSLGSFIAGFKGATTSKINAVRGTPGAKVWQRNYYEHVIRDEEDLERIRYYIENNPANWALDRFAKVTERREMDTNL